MSRQTVPDTEPHPYSAEPRSAPETRQLRLSGARLGNSLTVRRALPQARRRMVGTWCLLDHFGPMDVCAGRGMDVGPHPHMGLQTVTWLFKGELLHRNSLGYQQIIRPGQLNIMTAGQGIAHSEETPAGHSGCLHGVQMWIALPRSCRHGSADFEHLDSVPSLRIDDAMATVLVGSLCDGTASAASVHSPLLAADIRLPAEGAATLPLDPGFEHALLPVYGDTLLHDGIWLREEQFWDLGMGADRIALSSPRGSRLLLVGGEPFDEKLQLWWNFVAADREEIVRARADWEAGRRFGKVSNYRGERLPAPPLAELPGAGSSAKR